MWILHMLKFIWNPNQYWWGFCGRVWTHSACIRSWSLVRLPPAFPMRLSCCRPEQCWRAVQGPDVQAGWDVPCEEIFYLQRNVLFSFLQGFCPIIHQIYICSPLLAKLSKIHNGTERLPHDLFMSSESIVWRVPNSHLILQLSVIKLFLERIRW